MFLVALLQSYTISVQFGLFKTKALTFYYICGHIFYRMPYLINKARRIEFKDIDLSALNSYPNEFQPAAALISQWKSGQNVFELQTSGSTGVPKTIQLQRDKIIFSAKQTRQAFGLQPGDTLFCCLGLHYIAGFMMVMRALVLDCNLVVEEPVSNPLSGLNEDIKIDFASFIPLQMEAMLSDLKALKIMNGMKAILLGGGPVSANLEEKLQALKVPVYHTYSMTETYTHVAIKLINTPNKSQTFKPLPGVKLSIDTRGCLVINSYLTDNEDLVTNDLVYIHENGSFTWLGRNDNVIISGGIKIQLEKIENACAQVFMDLKLNRAFFAAGIPDEKLGQKLVLVVEGEGLSEEMINAINDQLSRALGKYELPKEVLFIKKFVLTRTGKLDRRGTQLMI